MADDPLIKAFDYYLAHQGELVEKYDGKFIAIKDDEVVGVYEDEAAALRETSKSFPLGTFLLQRVSPGDTAYSQTFYSRVAFA
jgi:hypothetical protein